MFKYAEKSPRITEDGTICWYEGDTFELTLNFNFVDAESGESIEPQPTDEILICFENFQSNETVYEAQFKGTNSIYCKRMLLNILLFFLSKENSTSPG